MGDGLLYSERNTILVKGDSNVRHQTTYESPDIRATMFSNIKIVVQEECWIKRKAKAHVLSNYLINALNSCLYHITGHFTMGNETYNTIIKRSG